MRKRQLCTLLKTKLFLNSYIHMDKTPPTTHPENIPLRDPKFYEKNNQAEVVAFSGGLTNDVGLRIPMNFLHAPPPILKEFRSRFVYDDTQKLWKKMAKQYEITSVVALPCDYRKG